MTCFFKKRTLFLRSVFAWTERNRPIEKKSSLVELRQVANDFAKCFFKVTKAIKIRAPLKVGTPSPHQADRLALAEQGRRKVRGGRVLMW